MNRNGAGLEPGLPFAFPRQHLQLAMSEALSSEWVAREVAILMDRHYGEGPERMRIVPIAVGGLDWEDLRKDSTDHRFAPLSAIQFWGTPGAPRLRRSSRGLGPRAH
jgi:hypothetical protein